MNQYFYEHQAREKLGQLRKEGQMSQAFNRNKPRATTASRTLPRVIAIAAALLTVILIWAF